MKEKLLFNPNGMDSKESRQMVNGNTTNIFNLNNTKYSWATKHYRIMMENFWIPEKVDLSSDRWENMDTKEQEAYLGILSFLIFLDSIQTNNLPNISDYITAPEINLLLAIQTYQEAIHSQSYQYVVETVLPVGLRDLAYNYWRKDNVLFERIEYIAKIYQDFKDNASDHNFHKVLVANYLLEGLYFYNGFNFFYNLASRSKMVGTSEVIRYINRDELTHVIMFERIITEVIDTKAEENMTWIKEMFDTAVEHEIKWSNHILGNDILGITKESTVEYTKYLANRRLRNIGITPPYEAPNNPYKHLEGIADTIGKGTVKTNIFENTVTSYNQASAITGWDDF